ncbi:MAG: hypothetical protein NW701_15380 [Nitrospira sp.]
MASFAELSELVGVLNEKDRETSKVLNCVESKLAGMDLNLESWLMSDPLVSEPAMIEGVPHQIDQVIGFGLHNGRHALLVKEVVHAREEGWESKGVQSHGPARLLREAPRELRFRSIGKMDALVDSLTVRARSIIEAFDAGRKEQRHC